MNVIFFGSDNFAIPSLKALLTSGHRILCVVTQPDRQKGRGLHFEGTAVKAVACQANLKIYQPKALNSAEAINLLKNLSPDLFIVISYGQILSQEVLNIPRIFSINVHASILPKYRGAAPINWAIIHGENTTGITIIKMTKKMDAGPIILQEEIEIKDEDTAITLEDKLSKVASKLLIDSLKSIENKAYNLTLQDERKITFAPKLKKEDGLISWNRPAQEICNLIKGCLNWPDAFTYYKGKLLKIYRARVGSLVREFTSSPPGEIIKVNKEGIIVATGKDYLIIEELQIEGKKRMKVEKFIAGHKICPGEIFGKK